MKDREYNEQRRRIRALTKKYQSIGLGWWKLDIEYARHPSDMPTNGNRQGSEPGKWECAASTNVAWEYRDAKITFNMEAAKNSDDEELERRFLHEYAHCLVNQMRAIAKDDGLTDNWIAHEESVCTSLANTIMWAYKAGQHAPKVKRGR